MRKLLFLIIPILLHGCAAYQPIPEGYKGPTATVTDSGFAENGSKAQFFVLAEINGNRIRNSFGASANASYGQGFALTPVYVQRKIPARPMQIKLVGSHATAAPIHSLFSRAAGTFLSVEGIVSFTPKPNGRYVIKGELKENGSSIWIEDAETREKITEVIAKK